jgi:hypothetical protein
MRKRTVLHSTHENTDHEALAESAQGEAHVHSRSEGQFNSFVLFHWNQSRMKFGCVPYKALFFPCLSFYSIFSRVLSLLGHFWEGGRVRGMV